MRTTQQFASLLARKYGSGARAYEAHVARWGISSSPLHIELARLARAEGYPA